MPQVVLGLPLEGFTHAYVGIFQAITVPIAIALVLRLVSTRLEDIGLTTSKWPSDVTLGLSIAIGFALLQFLVVIPNTGGANRSDVAVNSTQSANRFLASHVS